MVSVGGQVATRLSDRPGPGVREACHATVSHRCRQVQVTRELKKNLLTENREEANNITCERNHRETRHREKCQKQNKTLIFKIHREKKIHTYTQKYDKNNLLDN